MDTPRKILIFYASAGHGHEKAAKAVLEAVQEKYPDSQSKAVDVISLMPPFFGEVYRQTYLLQIKYAPWLWGVFYYSFDVPWIYFFMRGIRRVMNSANSRNLERLVANENPDTIFTTHFLAAEVISHLKEKRITKAKLITIVTDYLPHYVWTAKNVDRYAVGLPETVEGLVHRGVAREKIEITGIPVEKKFFKPVSRTEILKNLQFKENIFTALLTSGGIGMGAVEPLLEKLLVSERPVQLILVCGSNQALFKRMKTSRWANPRLCVLGFVSNMNELMEVSDVVIGKAGGLTITESFLKGRPVILMGSIPGQETRNVICVKAHGAGIEAQNTEEVAQIVLRLGGSPNEMEQLKKGVASIARPDAAEKIALLAQKS